MKIAGISIFKISIPGILIAFIYVFQYFGIPFLIYFQTENLISLNLDKSILILVFLYTSLTITLLIFGFIFARFSFGKIKELKTESFLPLNTRQLRVLNLMTIFCLIVLTYYINKIGFRSIALLNAVGLFSDLNIGVARSTMTNSFEGSYHWYKLIITDLFSFVFLTLFSNYLISKRPNKLYITIILLLLVFSLMLSTEKGPVMILFISIYFMYFLIQKNGYLNLNYLAQLFIYFFFILIFIYIFVLNFQNLSSSIIAIFERILTGQIIPAYQYLDYFPSKHDFLLGRSFPNPSGVLPFTPFPLTQAISSFYSDMPNDITGSSPTIFWGELYANFSLYGIFIFPIFIGYFLYTFNFFLLKLKPTAALIGYYCWAILHFSYLSGTSLSTYLFDIYLIIITFIFVIINWHIKINFQKNSKFISNY
jgi:hypothetical protein